ncbi:MAG TPA: PKD domain-containing protein [Solirubrobacteraceae bacterium]
MHLFAGQRRVVALASSVLVLGLAGAPAASAAPGDFDSSFASGGTVLPQLSTGSSATMQVQDVVVDSAGRILVAGSTATSSGSDAVLYVERYEANGALDTSFGNDGVFELAVSGEAVGSDGLIRLALEPDGDIAVATTAEMAGVPELLVAQVTPAGSLDTSFDSADTPGYVQQQVDSHGVTPIVADETTVGGLAVAPTTGDIWVDGQGTFGSSQDAFLECLTSSGTPCGSDSTGTAYDFGSGSSPSAQAAGIVVEADGSILIGLEISDTSGDELGLAHFTADGSLDSTFGSAGVSLAYPGGTPLPGATVVPIRLVADGSGVVLLGAVEAGTAYPVLMGFSTQGALDPTFGSEGTATFRLTTSSTANTAVYGIAVQPDGKLDLAGYSQDSGSSPFAAVLVRLTPAGALDPSFGTGGAVTQQFAPGTLTPYSGSLLYADAIDSAGQLILGGFAAPAGSPESGVLARVFLDQPAAAFAVSPTNPVVGQTVTLSGAGSDVGGTITGFGWDFNGVGAYTSATGSTVSTSFTSAGPHTVGLQVTDSDGQTATAQQTITVSPAPRPAASSQKTTAKLGDQLITLITPALSACTASSKRLAAALTSTTIPKSKGAKLKFSSAAFYIDKGVKHTHRKTTGKGKKKKTVKVTTYSPNATAKHLPATPKLSLKGLKAGTHTLTVKVSYKKSVKKHGHKRTVTVTKTLKAKFKVC